MCGNMLSTQHPPLSSLPHQQTAATTLIVKAGSIACAGVHGQLLLDPGAHQETVGQLSPPGLSSRGHSFAAGVARPSPVVQWLDPHLWCDGFAPSWPALLASHARIGHRSPSLHTPACLMCGLHLSSDAGRPRGAWPYCPHARR